MISESPAKTKEKNVTKVQKLYLLEQGKNLVYQLYVSIRTAQLYDRSNSVYMRQGEKLLGLIKALLEKEQDIFLKSKEGYLFLNETRLKFSFDGYVSSKFIMETFRKLQYESLIINSPLTPEELDEFVFIMAHVDTECENPFESLQTRVHSSNIQHIRIEKFASEWDVGDQSLPENQKKLAKKRFFKTLSVAQETMETAKAGRSINTVKSKRAIQFLIDQLIKEEGNLMSLTAIKNFDEYTFAHSVNVCILSVSLGARLGLSKRKLSELGFAALFHDVGKVKLPLEILNKPDELSEKEWEEVKKHPVFGVKTLLSKRSLDRFSTRAMVVAFEHHLKMDLSGYPRLSFKKDINLYTRIVTIADVYDSMTSGRVYAKKPLTPEEALRKMLENEGKAFDPVLLKVFINMLGIYPAGSVVILDTGEVGVVMKANPTELSRPEVTIIADKTGKKDKIETVDLTKIDEKTGKHKRTILKTIAPRQYKLDIARYIY
ncbi:MAG: HD-GYP domain-containing protein [candidate division Zixibacteria bacterium]|nr:HD-GYP domain-containing protein [candidate division Zixibacteria bacterium]